MMGWMAPLRHLSAKSPGSHGTLANLRGDKFHPKWNHAVIPRTPDSKELRLSNLRDRTFSANLAH
jgi:hypothetical protein